MRVTVHAFPNPKGKSSRLGECELCAFRVEAALEAMREALQTAQSGGREVWACGPCLGKGFKWETVMDDGSDGRNDAARRRKDELARKCPK